MAPSYIKYMARVQVLFALFFSKNSKFKFSIYCLFLYLMGFCRKIFLQTLTVYVLSEFYIYIHTYIKYII